MTDKSGHFRAMQSVNSTASVHSLDDTSRVMKEKNHNLLEVKRTTHYFRSDTTLNANSTTASSIAKFRPYLVSKPQLNLFENVEANNTNYFSNTHSSTQQNVKKVFTAVISQNISNFVNDVPEAYTSFYDETFSTNHPVGLVTEKTVLHESFIFKPSMSLNPKLDQISGNFGKVRSLLTFQSYKNMMFWGRDITLNIALILGILSNVFIIIVAATLGKGIEKSLKIYIICQAIIDIIQSLIKIYINVTALWRDRYPTWGSYVFVITNPYIHKCAYYATRSLFFYIILIICIQRCIAVYSPFKVKTSLLTRRPMIIITILFVINFAFFALNILRYRYREVYNDGLNATIYQDTTANFDKKIAPILPVIITFYKSYPLIPITLILLTSLAVVVKIKIIRIHREKLVAAGTLHQISNQAANKKEKLTHAIIGLAIASVLCNSLTFIITTIMFFKPCVFIPNYLFMFRALLFLSTIPHGFYSIFSLIILMVGSSAFKQHFMDLIKNIKSR